MLQVIRGTAGSWIVKILFLLLILSFGVWGVGDMVRKAGHTDTAITVGGTKITLGEVDHEFRRRFDKLRGMLGGELTQEQAKRFGLLDQTIDQLTKRALFDQAATEAGIEVGANVVKARIAADPAFRGAGGTFDPNVFQGVLRNAGLSEGEYAEAVRHDLATELTAGVVASTAFAPKTLIEALYRHRGERRAVDAAALPLSAAGDVGTPDDAAIRGYYDEHSTVFTAPEYRTLTVARVTTDMLADKIEVSDDELRPLYEERIDEFRKPERRSFKIALVDSEDKANAIADAAKTKDFEGALKDAGVEATNFDNVAQADLPEIGDTFFAADLGAIAGPIKSPLGWHVGVVTAIQAPDADPYETVKPKLLDEVRHERAIDRLFDLMNKIEDGLAAGTALEDVAKLNGMSIETVTDVDATGKAKSGAALSNNPDWPVVLKTAFTQAPNQTGPLVEAVEGRQFVVRVDTLTQPVLRPLEEVEDQVIEGWKASERERIITAKADEIAKAVRENGADLKAAVEAAGGTFARPAPFTRDAKDVKEVPEALVARVFSMTTGEVEVGDGDAAKIIVRPTAIVAADPAAPGADLSVVRKSVEGVVPEDVASQFAEALRVLHPVTVETKRIDELYQTATPN